MEKYSHEDIYRFAKHLDLTKVEILEEAFWEFYPNETTWSEFKQCNLELYYAMQIIGRRLVQLGRVKKKQN